MRIRGELTSVLEKVEAIGSHGNRQTIADMLSDTLPEWIFLKREAGRLQLLELVRARVKWSNELKALIGRITALDRARRRYPS